MSIDKSLKLHGRLQRQRSVLTRAERIAELRDSGRWQEGDSVFGLPKVRVQRARRRPKAAKATAEEAAAAPADVNAAESESASSQPDTEKKSEKK